MSLGKAKATNCSLMSITVAAGPQRCWGPLRLHEDHAWESLAQEQKSWGHLLSSVGYGSPPKGSYQPLPQHNSGLLLLVAEQVLQVSGKALMKRREKRAREVGGCQCAGNCPL